MKQPFLALISRSAAAAAAAYDPLVLSPSGWWDPSDAATVSLSGSNITQINDKSGNAKHLVGHGGNYAIYQTASINGLNAIGFTTVSQYLDVAASSIPQPYTIFLVCQLADTSVQVAVDFGANSAGYSSGTGAWRYYAGSVSGGTPVQDTSLHLITWVINGASSSIQIDATSTSINPGTNATGTTWGLGRIGQGFANGGKAAEYMLVPSAVSGTPLTDYKAYIKAKWGTP